MSYVTDALLRDERVVYTGEISFWSLLPLIVIGFLLLSIKGIGIIFWIIALIRYQTTELVITNKRVIAKVGLIRRRTIEMNVRKIESIQVEQSMLGRMCDYGSLVISGAGNPQTPIPDISNPMNFRRKVLMEAEKTK